MSNYPEHEKLEKVVDKSQAVGEFLEWLGAEKNMSICVWDDENDRYFQTYARKEQLLAEYYGIDQKKLEEEKQAMLKSIRGE